MSYNKIMVHNVKYNGLSFLNSPFFRPQGWFLCLKEFSFFEVATSAATEKYAISHGEYVSPTLKKNRRIRFLFDIIANSEEERWLRLKKVQRAFSPEQNPSPFNPNLWKPLEFQDVNWDTWTTNCQVIKGVELSDFWNEKRVWISVELITDSSEFKNKDTQLYTGWRNTRFWKRLDQPVWFGLEYEYYREVIEYWWVLDSPLHLRLKVTAENPCPNNSINIIHEWNWENEGLQIADIDELDLEIWDTIILDTEERRALLVTRTWFADITWMITLGSQRPLLKLWDNIIAVDTWATEKTMDVEIERNEVF